MLTRATQTMLALSRRLIRELLDCALLPRARSRRRTSQLIRGAVGAECVGCVRGWKPARQRAQARCAADAQRDGGLEGGQASALSRGS
eukprot:6207254-Pleurochrysis_carterae.AAC.1